MNIVDLTAIIPFYLEIGLSLCGVDVESLSDIKGIPQFSNATLCYQFVNSFYYFNDDQDYLYL